MATCEETKAKIPLFLDDELHGAARATFERHIKKCVDCREALAEEYRFIQMLQAAGPLYDIPVELRKRIEQIIKSTPQRKRRPNKT